MPGGSCSAGFKRSRWLGVKASGSRRLGETVVRVRPFNMLSTFYRKLGKLSSSIICVPRSALRILRMVPIQRSHTPPKWEPYGGLKIHLTLFCGRLSWILLRFHELLLNSLISRSPPVKLVALSDLISLTWPRLAINLLSAIRKESVSKLYAISRCTARIARHVKMTPYLFMRARPRRKQSTPTEVKGGSWWMMRSAGKSAIFCWQKGSCLFLQSKHLERTHLMGELAWMIQSFSRTRLRTCSLPEWPEVLR